MKCVLHFLTLKLGALSKYYANRNIVHFYFLLFSLNKFFITHFIVPIGIKTRINNIIFRSLKEGNKMLFPIHRKASTG